MSIESELLLSFADQFFGYGDLNSPIWFVGMEEGGGKTESEINARLAAWAQRGGKCVEDLPEYCRATGLPDLNRWFRPNAPIQPTWNRLILIAAVLQGKEPPDLENRKTIQRSSFAKENRNECLLELFPLPSPGKKDWHYSQWTKVSQLVSRAVYHCHYGESRSLKIWEMISQHEPRFVIFHGPDHLKYFKMIRWVERKYFNQRFGTAKSGNTRLASIFAGSAMVAAEYYIEAARSLVDS